MSESLNLSSMQPRHTTKTTSARKSRQRNGAQSSDTQEIIDWLRDAYAMKRSMEGSLEKLSQTDGLSPSLRERASVHLEQTRIHADQLRAALRSLGSDISTVKTGLGIAAQAAKGLGTTFADDKRIKDLLDAYSMEHLEIASHTALTAAAEIAGLTEVAQICRRIIPDEQRMADRIIHSLPDEVIGYFFRGAS